MTAKLTSVSIRSAARIAVLVLLAGACHKDQPLGSGGGSGGSSSGSGGSPSGSGGSSTAGVSGTGSGGLSGGGPGAGTGGMDMGEGDGGPGQGEGHGGEGDGGAPTGAPLVCPMQPQGTPCNPPDTSPSYCVASAGATEPVCFCVNAPSAWICPGMTDGGSVTDCPAGTVDGSRCAMASATCLNRNASGKVAQVCVCDPDGTWACE